MSKYKLWNSVIQGKSIAYDIDSNWEIPIDYQLNNRNNFVGNNFVFESPNKIEFKNPEIKRYSNNIFPSWDIIFVFSKKYPINIEFRTKNVLTQEFDSNIPNLQFLEDIFIKGGKLKKIEKKELRIDKDESKLTDFELSFWDFLQNTKYKSFRDFLIGANTFKVPKSKSSIIINKFDTSGYSILNAFFSQNNFFNIIEKYRLKFFYGYIKSEDTAIDKFDYNTNESLLKPEYSKHFQNYWNQILLDENNILCAYNEKYSQQDNPSEEYYTKNVEQFSFVHFNNLFPDVIDYDNPLLIKLIEGYNNEDYSNNLIYNFEFNKDKPNRNNDFEIKVDNPHICFTDLTGILRHVDGKLFFYPSSRVYEITITDYNKDTNITTFDIIINGTNKSVERILPGITEDSKDLEGQLYISDNFTFYVYLEEPLI